MKMASVSQLKARLNAYLEIVRQGGEVVVTDRGRMIARIGPMVRGQRQDSRRDALLRSGQLRVPTAALPASFWKRARPADSKGRSLRALLEERDDAR